MRFFGSKYIKHIASKKGIKIVDIKEMDLLNVSHQVKFTHNEIPIEEFLAIAKDEKVRTIFCEEVFFAHESYHINLYDAHVYLKEKHNLKEENKEDVALYDRVIERLVLRNERLYLLPSTEIVQIKLTFVVDDTYYVMVFQEGWYYNLLQTHIPMEEVIDSIVEFANKSKKKED
ncbi:TPA: hypothetical protein QCU60_004329 [Bacillus cereus]|nr:hypothetical protein [Bacillus cereus]HDR6312343.1 hypothetical protein [Bacillus cereus]